MLAYKYRLYPTKEQKVLLAKHFGCTRWIYNKCLALKTESYQIDKKNLSRFAIQSLFTKWKDKEETKWLKEVNSQSLQVALLHLDIAFTNFFKKKGNYPKFKGKSNDQSFSFPQGGAVDFSKNRFYCPKFREGIKCIFSRQFTGKIKTCTISQTPSGKYFVSILVDSSFEKPNQLPIEEDKILGIDLGIKDFATFSNGTKCPNSRFLNKKLKQLKRASKNHSRKSKGSKNKNKSRKKLAIIHEKVANCRKDFQHKLSYQIAENQSYTSVAVETLNINGMLKNRRLARHISDAAWFQFKTFLKYKLERRGKRLLEIGTFEPSSKKCSCGEINKELSLNDRIWTCKKCGTTHDRDILAARNIKTFAFIGKGNPKFKSVEKPVRVSVKQKVI